MSLSALSISIILSQSIQCCPKNSIFDNRALSVLKNKWKEVRIIEEVEQENVKGSVV